MLIDTHTVQRTHYYENSRVKIKLQLEYIPCKYQENILRHENMKKETAAQWESRNEQLQEEPTHPRLHLLMQPDQVPMQSNTLKKEILASMWASNILYLFEKPRSYLQFIYICKEDEVGFQMWYWQQ